MFGPHVREAGSSEWIGFVNTRYGTPHECMGTLRTTGEVCAYVFGLQMEIILMATTSFARACSN